MSKLPQVSGKRTGRVLVRLGFSLKSQKGSHMKFTRFVFGREETIVIPNHKILRKGTLNDILAKLNMSVVEFKKLL